MIISSLLGVAGGLRNKSHNEVYILLLDKVINTLSFIDKGMDQAWAVMECNRRRSWAMPVCGAVPEGVVGGGIRPHTL